MSCNKEIGLTEGGFNYKEALAEIDRLNKDLALWKVPGAVPLSREAAARLSSARNYEAELRAALAEIERLSSDKKTIILEHTEEAMNALEFLMRSPWCAPHKDAVEYIYYAIARLRKLREE